MNKKDEWKKHIIVVLCIFYMPFFEGTQMIVIPRALSKDQKRRRKKKTKERKKKSKQVMVFLCRKKKTPLKQ